MARWILSLVFPFTRLFIPKESDQALILAHDHEKVVILTLPCWKVGKIIMGQGFTN
jgi:hypothetical protein